LRHTFSPVAILVLCASTACSRSASTPHNAGSPLAPSATALTAQASCQTIEGNTGALGLKQDLSGPDASCLRLIGGSGELDCMGHDVQSLELTDVHGMTVRNCRMRGVLSTRSTGITLTNNIMTADTRKTVGTVVRFSEGNDNRIIQNTIDGSWRGQPYPAGGYPPGADDGIVIENDANLVIEGNAIRNVWDCGIERLGNRTDPVTIRNNDISNAAECGIGGWFSAGWQDSLIVDNTVSTSGAFAEIYFSPNQNRGVDHITFRNNVFENNRFLNPLGHMTASVNIDYITGTSRLPLDIGNNIFRNNDFGSDISAPRLAPAFGFVDGGANVCRQDAKSALACVR
jgi:parallel beta helix pectate lyase-like protein